MENNNNNNLIPEIGDTKYSDILFITNALRNLHKMSHSRKCFNKEKYECRMKVPMKECNNFNVNFDNGSKEWYDWTGRKHLRDLFVVEQKRQFIDCFVNTYNEIATATFGCNTNIVTAVDGGSIIYCTLCKRWHGAAGQASYSTHESGYNPVSMFGGSH